MSDYNVDNIDLYLNCTLALISNKLDEDGIDPDERFILLGKKFAYYDVIEKIKYYKEKEDKEKEVS